MTLFQTRMPTQYVITGTRSFRLGARQWFGEFGANLQNPGKSIIEVYAAPPGRVIVQADQAGAEALIVAHDAKPGNYRALFQNGIKPHTFLALHIFADDRADWFDGVSTHPATILSLTPANLRALGDEWKTIDKRIKSSDKEYAIGKRTAHGKSYRMGPRTFRLANLKQSDGTLNLSHSESVTFLGKFDNLFPEVIELQDEIEYTINKHRVLRNCFGHPRAFERVITDSYIREAISWRPQSTVGCITHEAFINMQGLIERDRRTQWDLVSNKHDSLAVECPECDAGDVARLLLSFLRIPLTGRDGVEYTMGAEVQVGRNWGKASKYNPEGMKDFKV